MVDLYEKLFLEANLALKLSTFLKCLKKLSGIVVEYIFKVFEKTIRHCS